jgi:hypothetical protein
MEWKLLYGKHLPAAARRWRFSVRLTGRGFIQVGLNRS